MYRIIIFVCQIILMIIFVVSFLIRNCMRGENRSCIYLVVQS